MTQVPETLSGKETLSLRKETLSNKNVLIPLSSPIFPPIKVEEVFPLSSRLILPRIFLVPFPPAPSGILFH